MNCALADAQKQRGRPLNRVVRAHVKHIALATGIAGAIICAVLAGQLLTSGRVFVPGLNVWGRGEVGGIGAYAMAVAWLALGAASIFASCMRAFPQSHARHESRRNVALVSFGAMFIVAVIGFVIQQGGVRAP
jgi:hypothetical protein